MSEEQPGKVPAADKPSKCADKKKGEAEETVETRSHYVLLLDQALIDVPVEACFMVNDAGSVSRDFSLNMLVRRLRSSAASLPDPEAPIDTFSLSLNEVGCTHYFNIEC